MDRVIMQGLPRRALDNRSAKDKVVAILKEAWKLLTMAIVILAIAFIAWAIMNGDVLWKAMRYPEAVRQMQIEIIIKK